MSQFKATQDSTRYARNGAWEVTGDTNAVIGAAVLNANDSDAHLLPMAAEILAEQMGRLEVGGKLMFNWACSVLNVKVERIS